MRFIWLSLILTFGLGATCAAERTIEWRVETTFAPFSWLENPSTVSEKWLPGADEDFEQWVKRVADINSGRSAFAPFTRKTQKNPWNARRGRYDEDYARPKNTTIRVRVPGESRPCEWQIRGQNDLIKVPDCSAWEPIKDVPLKTNLRLQARFSNDDIPTTDIYVDHRVIVALGDSYASGEGNPDVPTLWPSTSVDENDLAWLKAYEKGAEWWDRGCHRSFWSSQTFVALKLAAQDSHRLVTFLHYACSGAEILDGMIVRQYRPQGSISKECPSKPQTSGSRGEANDECFVPRSQLAAMVSDLCEDGVEDVGRRGHELEKSVKAVVMARKNKLWRADIFTSDGLDVVRCNSELRNPDLVLLSIGGNDAGFAGLVAWAVLPSQFNLSLVANLVRDGVVVCPDRSRSDEYRCKMPYDIDLSKQLLRRHKLLVRALKSAAPNFDQRKVVQSTYPNPLKTSSGTVCSDGPKKAGQYNLRSDGPWHGAAHIANSELGRLAKLKIARVFGRLPNEWEFNVLYGEADPLSKWSIPEMTNRVREGIGDSQFLLADIFDLFYDHGWCAPSSSDPPLSLPSHAKRSDDKAAWSCGNIGVPRNPSCWNGYAPAKRYIRTFNDSLLTQSSGHNDGYTGTMHPNLGGHAAMAEEIYRKIVAAGIW